ncbi:MAG: DUF3795 domain-containing protein [Armatimonadota bacterium]
MDYIGACGMLCNECSRFTSAENRDAIKEIEDPCEGCINDSKNEGCNIRQCVVDKEVANCGYCDEYPCDAIDGCSPMGSENRQKLDQIHSEIKA